MVGGTIRTTLNCPRRSTQVEPPVWPRTSKESVTSAIAEILCSVYISRMNLNVVRFISISVPSLHPTYRLFFTTRLQIISLPAIFMSLYGCYCLYTDSGTCCTFLIWIVFLPSLVYLYGDILFNSEFFLSLRWARDLRISDWSNRYTVMFPWAFDTKRKSLAY